MNLLLQLKESVNEHLFSGKIILWRKMAKIWRKIWLKVKEIGTKKNQIGENGGERKKILVRTLVNMVLYSRSVRVGEWVALADHKALVSNPAGD